MVASFLNLPMLLSSQVKDFPTVGGCPSLLLEIVYNRRKSNSPGNMVIEGKQSFQSTSWRSDKSGWPYSTRPLFWRATNWSAVRQGSGLHPSRGYPGFGCLQVIPWTNCSVICGLPPRSRLMDFSSHHVDLGECAPSCIKMSSICYIKHGESRCSHHNLAELGIL